MAFQSASGELDRATATSMLHNAAPSLGPATAPLGKLLSEAARMRRELVALQTGDSDRYLKDERLRRTNSMTRSQQRQLDRKRIISAIRRREHDLTQFEVELKLVVNERQIECKMAMLRQMQHALTTIWQPSVDTLQDTLLSLESEEASLKAELEVLEPAANSMSDALLDEVRELETKLGIPPPADATDDETESEQED